MRNCRDVWIGDGLQRREDGGAEHIPDRSEGKIAKVYTAVKPAEHSEQVPKDLAKLKKKA
jgi:hypothetical protein